MYIPITQEVYNYLVNHMMYLHHQKLSIIKGYSLDYDAYMHMLEFLNEYIKKIEYCLDHSTIISGESLPPFVILGSTALIGRQGKTTECCLVLPNGGRMARQKPGAMVLIAGTESADALLFKKVGQSVSIGEMNQSGLIEKIIYDEKFLDGA